MSRNRIFVLLLFCYMLQLTQCTDKYHCVWYGKCGTRKNLQLACAANNTAKPINNSSASELLRGKCPQYFENTGISFIFIFIFIFISIFTLNITYIFTYCLFVSHASGLVHIYIYIYLNM